MVQVGRWLTLGLATGGFLSYLPAWLLRSQRLTGAGLVGSLWGVLLLPWLPLDPVSQIAVWTALLAISVPVSDYAEELLKRKDDPRIVIDETLGYWTAVLFLPRTFGIVAWGFIFFRVLDVWKPGLIPKAAKLPGGWGIVLDDVFAGVVANLLLQFLHAFHLL